MKTIDQILKESGYTKKFLLECRASGRANYELIIRILQLLHWTTISGRL